MCVRDNQGKPVCVCACMWGWTDTREKLYVTLWLFNIYACERKWQSLCMTDTAHAWEKLNDVLSVQLCEWPSHSLCDMCLWKTYQCEPIKPSVWACVWYRLGFWRSACVRDTAVVWCCVCQKWKEWHSPWHMMLRRDYSWCCMCVNSIWDDLRFIETLGICVCDRIWHYVWEKLWQYGVCVRACV